MAQPPNDRTVLADPALVAASLPLVYNVVQDTTVRAVGGLGELREPERFR